MKILHTPSKSSSYKFSSANFLRLLASNNDIIRKCDPRWISSSVIKNNNWSLRQSAQPKLLEVWNKSSDGGQLCSLTEFYNAKDILDKDSFTSENQELENIINFFQTRGLLKRRSNIISFHSEHTKKADSLKMGSAFGLDKIVDFFRKICYNRQ